MQLAKPDSIFDVWHRHGRKLFSCLLALSIIGLSASACFSARGSPELQIVTQLDLPKTPQALAWKNGGEWLAVVGWQKMVMLINVKSGKLQTIEQDNPINEGVAFSPDGRYLAVGRAGVRRGAYVTVYSLSPLQIWKEYTGSNQSDMRPAPAANGIAFSASGRELLVGGYGSQRELAIFGMEKNSIVKVMPLGNERTSITNLAANPVRSIVAIARTLGVVDIVDIESQKVLHSWTPYPVEGPDRGWSIKDITYSSDGRLLALSTETGVRTETLDRTTGKYIKRENMGPVKIYDTESWTLLREIPVREHETAMALSFLSDNQYLVAGTVNGLVVVWDAQTGKVVQQKKVSRYNLLVKAIDRTIAVAGMGDRKLNILMLISAR